MNKPLLKEFDLNKIKEQLKDNVPTFFRDEEHDWDYPNVEKFQAMTAEFYYNKLVYALRKFQDNKVNWMNENDKVYCELCKERIYGGCYSGKYGHYHESCWFKEVFGVLDSQDKKEADKK